MRHESLYLTDILEAADHIAEFLGGRPAMKSSAGWQVPCRTLVNGLLLGAWEKTMFRYLGVALLAAAFAAPVSVTAKHKIYRDRDGRYYDASARDWHEWNEREDRAYREYLKEQRRDYREWEKVNRKEQRDYWRWRHRHPNEVLFPPVR